MKFKSLILAIILFGFSGYAQKLSVKGNVQDTVTKTALQNAVVTLIKLSDSTLIDFTRTDINGVFEISNMPIDTYKVIISYKKFGDKTFYVVGSKTNYDINFNKVIMPPKSTTLDEVTIFAYKDPVYYKGDTLIYTADSFKTKPNATVEDLLRRLPGVRVDAAGKITAQGKEVSKVLVDGDEFFGADPTMATKNLAANSVESVQVYEKKDENTSAESTNDELIKVMNLKLKDDAKKGYYGKVSGGSDFQKFYEGDILLNKFKKKQKISFFALGANTPKTGFGWSEIEKYGLENERNYSWDEDNGYTSTWDNQQGVPRTFNGGIYYSDKYGKKTKINSNYSYKNNLVLTQTEQHSQYFLEDTNYVTDNISTSSNENQSHKINITITTELDSLTKLTIAPKASYNLNNSSSSDINSFATTSDIKQRETENTNSNSSINYNLSTNLRLNRSFKKKDRNLFATYLVEYGNNENNGILKTTNSVYTSTVSFLTDIDQKKVGTSNNLTHIASVGFFEPFTKKFKGEMTYEFTYNANDQYKTSLNKLNNDYSVLDSVFSNDFSNERMINQTKVRLIYEVKKYRVTIGTRARQVNLTNTNNYTGDVFKQSVPNILPFFKYNYNFSQNTRLFFDYNANSQQPSISQLQPLPNNSNQNFITLGNPNLKPTFSHQFNLNYNTYKPVSGMYLWSGLNYNLTQNAFSSNLIYDSIGRSISTPTNINGNYNGGLWLGGNFPMFARVFNIKPSINVNGYSNNNIINNTRNTTSNITYASQLDFSLEFEKYVFQIGGSYDYNVPYSTLNNQNNKPYASQKFEGSFRLELPKKFFIESDANYNINTQRTNGYNINYVIVNGSVMKYFGKLENFIVAIKAYDILNQNVSANRMVYNNVITDTKTKIISRYFLFALTYKFNSQRTKEENDED